MNHISDSKALKFSRKEYSQDHSQVGREVPYRSLPQARRQIQKLQKSAVYSLNYAVCESIILRGIPTILLCFVVGRKKIRSLSF